MIDLTNLSELEALLESDAPTAVHALDYQVLVRGEKIAVSVGETGERVSYAELGRRTDALAGSFRALGVAPGDRIAVLSENPLTAVIAMFGAWKAGAVFAPINPDYSGDFLTYHLNDCGARVVIASTRCRESVEEVRRTVIEHLTIVVDEGSEDVSDDERTLASLYTEGQRPAVDVRFNDIASIIYTSGTTGPAKGVVLSHRWLNQYTWQYRRWMQDDDVVHVDLPMYHVGAAFFNVVKALWIGASVSLWKRFSASNYWDRIESAGATSALLLDVMVPWLIAQPATVRDARNTLRNVHMQPLPSGHREFAERFGIDFVTAGFGQTESGSAIFGLIDEFPDDRGGTPPELYRGLAKQAIREQAHRDGALVVAGEEVAVRGFMGRANPFLEITVHDPDGRLCAPGEIGELVVRPRIPSVIFSSYLGKPDYSLNAFRDLWFHTGDSALFDEDGVLYFDGRLGERIRVKGENISAYDVEELVSGHPKVFKVAAIGVPSSQGEEDDIVLFVEPVPGASLTSSEFLEYARETLPRPMRPRHACVIESFPVTQTNKVQKHKLRAMFVGMPNRDT